MSRLDYFTIFIVVVCILAIGLLLWQTTDIFGKKGEPSIEATTDTGLTEEDPLVADEDLFAEDDSLDTEAAESIYWNDEEGSDAGSGSTAAASDEDGIDYGEADSDAAGKEEDDYPSGEELAATGDYLVLGGTFEYMANAKRRLRALQRAGYSQAQVVLFDRGKYAVVLVDRFGDYSSASELVSELKNKGYEAVVYQK